MIIFRHTLGLGLLLVYCSISQVNGAPIKSKGCTTFFADSVAPTDGDNEPYLCKAGKTVSFPVYHNVVTLPCILAGNLENERERLHLYKGSCETHMEEIPWNDNRILSYDPNIGFIYNISTDSESTTRTYTCFVNNSSNNDFVTLNGVTNDSVVYLSAARCSRKYNVGEEAQFSCKVHQPSFSDEFRWFKGIDETLWPARTKNVRTETHWNHREQTVTISMSSGTKFVHCRVKHNNSSWKDDTVQVFVRDGSPTKRLTRSEILGPKVQPEEYETGTGKRIKCEYFGHRIRWLRNGQNYSSERFAVSQGKGDVVPETYTIPIPEFDGDTVTYTCVVDEVHMKDFVVTKKAASISPKDPPEDPPIVLYAVLSIMTVAVVLISVLFVAYMKSYIRNYWFVEELKKGDPTSHIPYEKMSCEAITSAPLKKVQNPLEARWSFCEQKIKQLFASDSTRQIDWDNMTSIEGGHYGDVFKTTMKERVGNDVKKYNIILKTYKCPLHLSDKEIQEKFREFITEIRISRYVGDHPNIVKYRGFYVQSVRRLKIFLIMEECSRGSLQTFLKEFADPENECQPRYDTTFENDIVPGEDKKMYFRYKRPRSNQSPPPPRNLLRTSHLMRWAEQLASAMARLEERGIVHRDLALRNILLNGPENGLFDDYVACLSDFGFSREVPGLHIYVMKEPTKPTPKHWYAIEALENKAYTSKCDVYSFGIVLWEMFNFGWKQPFPEVAHDHVLSHLQAGNRLEKPALIPPEIQQLMDLCWETEASARPTFAEVHEKLVEINQTYGIDDAWFNQEEPEVIQPTTTPVESGESELNSQEEASSQMVFSPYAKVFGVSSNHSLGIRSVTP